MTWKSKVVWSEGMFMRPQHFQQQDRYIENFVEGRCSVLNKYGWGIKKLELDQQALALGKIAIRSARGVLPDGTPFSFPDDDDPPPALEINPDVRDEIVYLALPVRRAGMIECDTHDHFLTLARNKLVEIEVKDSIAGADAAAPLHIGQLRLRMMLQRAERADFAYIGIARITEIKADKQVVLDSEYIAPVVDCQASARLATFVTDLRGLVHQRAEALAGRVSEAAQGGAAEIASFLYLQIMNRYEPLIEHVANVEGLHPEVLYRLCLEMAGELATLTTETRRPPKFAVYRHDDLKATFAPVITELLRCLGQLPDEVAVPIALEEKKYGIRVATVTDRRLFAKANFVLAVKASVRPEQIHTFFPQLAKLASLEDIRNLVNSQLPGIGLRLLPAVPRQIPFHAGYVYFELDRSSEHWKRLENSAGIALHIAKDIPDLALELWAIKEP